MVEQEQLDTLTDLVSQSEDMCPACKELFEQMTWRLMQEFEKAIDRRKRRRETGNRAKNITQIT